MVKVMVYKMIKLTSNHIELMSHTISETNRNWFGTSYGCKDSDDFEQLVDVGYATKETPPKWMGDDVIYRLTKTGKAAYFTVNNKF